MQTIVYFNLWEIDIWQATRKDDKFQTILIKNVYTIDMSQKRHPKKHLRKKKKDRIQATVIAANENLSVTYDVLHDKIGFVNVEVESLHHEVFYERDSGKNKMVSQVSCNADKSYLNQIQNLKDNVDFLFAVDTNTFEIDGQRTSFSVSYGVPHILSSYDVKKIPFQPFMAFEINEVCSTFNPECVGWHLLIQHIIKKSTYNLKHRITIAVDSELNLHEKINSLEIPYYSKYYLPNNMQIMYTSADTGKEFLANQMISYCDKMASELIKYFKDKKIKLNPHNNGNHLFRGFRPLLFKTH